MVLYEICSVDNLAEVQYEIHVAQPRVCSQATLMGTLTQSNSCQLSFDYCFLVL
jgi:hypothetical protein